MSKGERVLAFAAASGYPGRMAPSSHLLNAFLSTLLVAGTGHWAIR